MNFLKQFKEKYVRRNIKLKGLKVNKIISKKLQIKKDKNLNQLKQIKKNQKIKNVLKVKKK